MADLIPGPIELVRRLARGETAWSAAALPDVTAAQLAGLQGSVNLSPSARHGGRIPDPVPLRVLAEGACDRVLAGTGTPADWRAVAEYCGEVIRTQVLER